MLKKCFENTKIVCFACGAVAALIGRKILKSQKTRELCVKGLASGMKLKRDAEVTLQNIREDAQDMYYDATQEQYEEKAEESDVTK